MSSTSTQARPAASSGHPWFATMTTRRRVAVSTAVASLVFLAGGLLDWFVQAQYLPSISLMLGGIGIAVAVGALVYVALTDVQRRYQMMVERLYRVSELNHHIRNALQVIIFHNTANRTAEAIDQVNAEISRIEAVLREVSGALGKPQKTLPSANAASKKTNLTPHPQ